MSQFFASGGQSVRVSASEYIMQNARLDEAQAGIKFVGNNTNNLRDSDDTILMV